jgi:glycosyltransferase involved in cell wall biosynthesis
MRIGMVLAEGSLPTDVRVTREARALLAGAHRIFVLCRQNPGQPLEESWRGIEIERVKTLRQPFAVAQKLLFYLLLRDLRWEAHLHDFARRHALEALHVHDLPRTASVLRVGRSLGLPVVLDVHEDWPAVLVDVNKWFRSWWIKRWFMGQRRWRAYEARCVRAVDRVVVVVDAFRERLVASAGVPSTKFVVVGNTVDMDEFRSHPLDPSVTNAFPGEFVLLYIGTFGNPRRGVDLVIRAMPLILSHMPNARLLLVGDGTMKRRWETLSHRLGVSRAVTFTGWQPHERLPSYISRADVCLAPHHYTANMDVASPNKLFEYMAFGKPLVVSDLTAHRVLVDKTGAGLLFPPGNVDALVQAILKLRDPTLRATMGERAYKAAQTSYNWRVDSARLLQLYDELAVGAKAER